MNDILFEIFMKKLNMSNFVVSTEHADGLALLVARSSAGTVMTKFQSHPYIYIYIWDQHMKG